MNQRKFLDPEHKWRFDNRRFNGEVEMGHAPPTLKGTYIVELLAGYENEFGKDKIKKRAKGLENEIVEILCHFEMIFPTAFFDIMIHLLVHLWKEIELGGPAHLRCMWPIERYLCKLKSYVHNRSKPEGSIAEGYLAEECLTFCSRFLNNDAVPKFERCP
ncbi:hypothetical protein POM88_025216 [Heracleum sosnowskyi]|uniref:DUF4218 domain-containing protein n=1 Tax=Heracleum sosnowskyi TaxID=360622 RepID=A0AAD8I3L1_9APIA|nr:hypothetical protein POM88_025216 [Heracleum sosnowskyi]